MGSWDGIKSSIVKWVASTDSLDAEPGTLDGAMDLDRLVGVPGACRVITAILSKKRGKHLLVRTDKPKYHQLG